MDKFETIFFEKQYTYFIHPIIISKQRDILFKRLIKSDYWNLAVFPNASKEEEESYFLPYVRNIIYPTWEWSTKQKKEYFSKINEDRIKMLRDFHSVKFIHSGNDIITYGKMKALIFEVEMLFLSHDTAFIIFKTKMLSKVSLKKVLEYNHDLRYIDKQQNSKIEKNIKILYRNQEILTGFREYITKIYKIMDIENEVQEIYDKFMLVYNFTAIKNRSIKNINHSIQLIKLFTSVKKEKNQLLTEPIYLSQENKFELFGFSKISGIHICFMDKKNIDYENRLLLFKKVHMKIFLLAIFQRITLLNYTYELAKINDLLNNKKKIDYLRRNILKFTNTYKFSQISNDDEILILWQKWMESLEIEKIYKEVEGELSEFDEYISRIRNNKNNFLINLISTFFLPFTVISGVLGMNVVEFQNITLRSKVTLGVCLTVVVFVGIIVLLFHWFNKKQVDK